ncbi:PH domain-containing protein [Salinisphaera japonica]|nr:PH domain-containing protein [Salinisphaera japonica]
MNDSTDDGTHIPDGSKAAPGTVEDEQIIWSTGPGQIVNFHIYIIASIAAAIPGVLAPWPWVALAIVPVVIAGVYAWSVQAIRYELTHERLRQSWGVLTRRGEEIELYRVEDTSPTAPLLYRLNGRGNVDVLSTDRSAATLTLRAIKDHESIRNTIRERVEAMRRAKGVRLVE